MLDAVSEIKSRLNIEEIVSQYVKLKKVGRNFKGLCPFHKEKTPSFIVSPDKQMAFCFGCQKGGDLFSFIQEVEHFDFADALKFLAERSGIDLAKTSKGPAKKDKDVLISLNEQAAQFFEKYLWNSEYGEKVRQYLDKRGMIEETIRLFRLGLAPDSYHETFEHLVKKGFSHSEIVQAGLAVSKDVTSGEQTAAIYDRFRLRLIFPISDVQGGVIGFGARVLRKGEQPKYLNSPDTPVYNKSEVVYGISEAKNAIRELKEVVLVEGYMDVLASCQAGVKNTVAVSGTALTAAHVKLLSRYAEKFILAFDTDSAGREATVRAVEIIQPKDVEIRIAEIKDAKDPGDYAVKQPLQWRNAVLKAKSYMKFYLDMYKKLELDGLIERKKVIQELIPLLSGVVNKIERDLYIKQLATFWKLEPQYIYDEISRQKISKRPSEEPQSDVLFKASIPQSSEQDYLSAVILQFPQYAERIKQILDKCLAEYHPKTDIFCHPERPFFVKGYEGESRDPFLSKDISRRKAADFFDAVFGRDLKLFFANPDVDLFLSKLERETAERLRIRMLWFEIYHVGWDLKEVEFEVKKIVDRLLIRLYDERRKELLHSMVEAREQGRKEDVKSLFEEYVATFSG